MEERVTTLPPPDPNAPLEWRPKTPPEPSTEPRPEPPAGPAAVPGGPPAPPARKGEALRLLLAGLIGALLTAAIFLAVLLARGASAPTAPTPAAAEADGPGSAGLRGLLGGLQKRFRSLGSSGGFALRIGGDDVDLSVEEETDAVVVVARVKDAIADKFDIRVDGRAFTLRGERKLSAPGGLGAGTVAFSQTIHLPADVDPARMTSAFRDGVLRVRLPKR